MTNTTRFIARVIAHPIKPHVRHYHGLPPDLAKDRDSRSEMPIAEALLIEIEPDGVFLFRLSANGEFAGDTWHQSIEEAKTQAEFEFGHGLSNWESVPSDVEDVMAYVRKRAAP